MCYNKVEKINKWKNYRSKINVTHADGCGDYMANTQHCIANPFDGTWVKESFRYLETLRSEILEEKKSIQVGK